MTTSKIKGGSGFNEGGGTVFATNTGETKVISTEFNRDALPADEFRYGITEYENLKY